MKSKKILIVVIILIAILAIGGGIFAYLFVATDTFKSDKELFSKYVIQNSRIMDMLQDSQTIQVYKNLQNEDKYESNTDVKAIYSEGGEISNPINNLAATLDIQKDNEEKYYYLNGQILFNDEEYLETEIIKENGLYGIRFPDVAQQFVSIKDDDNLKNVASDLGIEQRILETFMEILDGEKTISEELVSQDEIKSLKEKYSNMIVETLSSGTFSSNKKAMITYNANTINAKAYTVTISSEQVENLLIEILNNIKSESVLTRNIKDESYIEEIDEQITILSDEEEVPAIKITVYEQSKKTIRTVVEIGSYKIVIENSEEAGKINSNIQISKIDAEQSNEYNIKITKTTQETQECFNIVADVIADEEGYTLEFDTEMEATEDSINFETVLSYKKDILTASVNLKNIININEDFEKKEKLEKLNNVTFNDIEQERRMNIIEALKTNIPLKVEKRLGLLGEALEIKKDETNESSPDYEMTQVEINKFNAKFEFYTGDEVSAENVKTLISVVQDNLGSYEIKIADNQENVDEIDEDELKYYIKLNIERNKKDEEGMNKVLEKINDDKKYKVSISYKDENQLIEYIEIEEIEE